jgi:hypothetical protein
MLCKTNKPKITHELFLISPLVCVHVSPTISAYKQNTSTIVRKKQKKLTVQNGREGDISHLFAMSIFL